MRARWRSKEKLVRWVADQQTGQQNQGHTTDPEIAAKFVAETGVDALAVSIGNIHFLEGGKVQLDFDLLEQVHERVSSR